MRGIDQADNTEKGFSGSRMENNITENNRNSQDSMCAECNQVDQVYHTLHRMLTTKQVRADTCMQREAAIRGALDEFRARSIQGYVKDAKRQDDQQRRIEGLMRHMETCETVVNVVR